MTEQKSNEEKLQEALREIDNLLFKVRIAYSIIALLAIVLFIFFKVSK